MVKSRKSTKAKGEGSSAQKIVKRQIQLFNDDVIVCLECGEEFATLHNHLSQAHNLRANEYLAKYGLPDDFPLVAKNARERMRIQEHPNRIKYATPSDITNDEDDQRRLKVHMKLRSPQDPAVPLDLSVIHGKGFVVLDDGRMVKQLSKYLQDQAKMTFEEYCEKWGLPDCYPKGCNSWFFKRPEEIAALREAEEARLAAKASGTPWPEWRRLEAEAEAARPKSERTSVRSRIRVRGGRPIKRTRRSSLRSD
jgi:predicted transcriptional regulator